MATFNVRRDATKMPTRVTQSLPSLKALSPVREERDVTSGYVNQSYISEEFTVDSNNTRESVRPSSNDSGIQLELSSETDTQEALTRRLLDLAKAKRRRKSGREYKSIPQQDEDDPEKIARKKQKKWDAFAETIEDTELYACEAVCDWATKIMKIVAYLLFAVIILGTALLNKGTLLYISSKVRNSADIKSSVRWVWALVFCLCGSYLVTFLRCLWRIFFKQKNSPDRNTLLFVVLVESLHCIGEVLFVTRVLPVLDAMRGVFTMVGVCVIPSILQLLIRKPDGKRHNKLSTFVSVLAMITQLLVLCLWPILTVVPVPHAGHANNNSSNNDSFAPTTIGISSTVATSSGGSPVPSPLTFSLPPSFTIVYPRERHVLMAPNNSSLFKTVIRHNASDKISSNRNKSSNGNTRSLKKRGSNSTSTDYPNDNIKDLAFIPVSLILMSLTYWENFVEIDSRLGTLGHHLLQMKKSILLARTKIYVVVSLLKIILTFILLLMFYPLSGGEVGDLFTRANFEITIGKHNQIPLDWVWTFLVQLLSGFVCYLCAKITCQVQMQRIGFSLPLSMATPVTFIVLIITCSVQRGDHVGELCLGVDADVIRGLFVQKALWVGILMWLSQMWITSYIWTPKAERMAKADKLFVIPRFSGPLIEQTLLLNRRSNELEELVPSKGLPLHLDVDDDTEAYGDEPISEPVFQKKDTVPMVYVCATMWHETETEMIQLLKSIFRLDMDQCARRLAQDVLQQWDPDYYEFEVHVMFDNAFEEHTFDEECFSVNKFVRQFVRVVDVAARSVHRVNITLEAPLLYTTPYGGRLQWTMPGGNKLIMHLKDKMKIRIKKRWSQVMYMFYLFGFRLMAQRESLSRKQTLADNTYILTLDGDIDFQPDAVQLLLDLLRKNDKVAAACGRIHPVGSGPLIWYQRFEYAISHWLQKSTEHILGCVLCSPGCFSLFRGSALMSVMKTYSKLPVEPAEYVQYDQGEDRWLCTLLLQQGYRVEYSAAADAMTYAPEGFDEFYNQRRRWMPSTFANIVDLLKNGTQTVKVNQNISMLYIVYQSVLFVSSVLAPATVFLMIVGAVQTVLSSYIDMWDSMLLNLAPVVLFLVLCFTTKPNTQLVFAAIFSAVYAIIMMLVVIGIVRSMVRDGFCSPTTFFTIFIASVFVFSALIHPKEFVNLIFGILYYFCVPSIFLFLTMYSICNLNVIAWGTRETVKEIKSDIPSNKKKVPASERLKKLLDTNTDTSVRLRNLFGPRNGATFEEEPVDGYKVTCCNMCRCFCIPRDAVPREERKINDVIDSMEKLEEQIEGLTTIVKTDKLTLEAEYRKVNENVTTLDAECKMVSENNPIIIVTQPESEARDTVDPDVSEKDELLSLDEHNESPETEPVPPQETPLPETPLAPHWVNDTSLKDCRQRELSWTELQFWRELIEDYLYPLEVDPEHQKKVQLALNDLRNKAAFAFFIFDALFIALIFIMQIQKSEGAGLAIPIPCHNGRGNSTTNVLKIEPIGLTFIFIFGFIILIQFFGMIVHQLGTFMHIVSATRLFCEKHISINADREKIADVLQIVREWQRLKDSDDDAGNVATVLPPVADGRTIHNRKYKKHKAGTIAHLEALSKPQKTVRLDDAFAKRYATATKRLGVTDPKVVLTHTMHMRNKARKSIFPVFSSLSSNSLEKRMKSVDKWRRVVKDLMLVIRVIKTWLGLSYGLVPIDYEVEDEISDSGTVTTYMDISRNASYINFNAPNGQSSQKSTDVKPQYINMANLRP